MSRPIKFRAWINDEVMYYPDKANEWEGCTQLVIDPSGSCHTFTNSVDYGSPDYPGGPSDHYEYVPVMQYTGLKDKNGVEIYEGDIVRTEYDNPASDGTQVCEITWDDSLPGFTDGYHDGLHSDIEVIGNVYENPELIGGTDDTSS